MAGAEYIIGIVSLGGIALASAAFMLGKKLGKSESGGLAAQLDERSQLLESVSKERDAFLQEKQTLQTQLAVAKEKHESLESKLSDFEALNKATLEANKAALFETSDQLTKKLLEDHKREAQVSKEEGEKRIKETTEELNKQFKNVFESMKSLSDQVSSSRETIGVVREALLNPTGAGSLAEITLENIFKASGLVGGTDYVMQATLSGDESNLGRPDAIVYLPGDNLLVVDAKASKFFQQIAEEKDEAKQKELEQKLKATMQNHAKDLIKRDYAKYARQDNKVQHCVTLMFLPTENALERLRSIDPTFEEKSWQSDILPVGPTGLVNFLLHSRMLISNARQDANAKVIVQEVRKMLENVSSLYSHAQDVGKGLKRSIEKYDAFAGSFNRNFLSGTKRLNKLGIEASKNKDVGKLERYSLVNSTQLIEAEGAGEDEESSTVASLPSSQD